MYSKKTLWLFTTALFLLCMQTALATNPQYNSIYDVFGVYSQNNTADINLSFQVRSCNNPTCTGTNFIGPNGTNSTWYTTDFNNNNISFDLNAITDNRYFQYTTHFVSLDGNYTPKLYDTNVTYNTFPADVNLNIGNNATNSWNWQGGLASTVTINDTNTNPTFSNALNTALATGTGCGCPGCTYYDTNNYCQIPFTLSSSATGKITASNINIQYSSLSLDVNVKDLTGQPIQNALIEIFTPTGSTTPWKSAYTNAQGDANFTTINSKKYDIKISKTAYNTNTTNTNIDANGTLNITLTPLTIGRLTTFKEGKPRSFLGQGEKITIRYDVNVAITPTITITDSTGTTIIDNNTMSPTGYTDTNTYDYNYTLNGANGWYNISIWNKVFEKAFYQAPIWQDKYTSNDGNVFPFSFDLNIQEPNLMQRWFTPIDTPLDFSYYTSLDSVRVLDFNGTNYLEIPSQAYNPTFTGSNISGANVAFLVSLDKNELRNFVISYTSVAHNKNYPTDLNTTQNGYIFDFNNSEYKTTIDINQGGTITKIQNKKGSNTDLNGNNPMQLSPEIQINPAPPYRITSITNPTFTQNTNGAIVSKITVQAAYTPIMDYNISYTFYAKNPFILIDTNINPLSPTAWNHYFDAYYFGGLNKFQKLAINSLGTVTSYDINAGNNIWNLSDINFLAFYNKITFDSIGEIFLQKTSSKTINPTTEAYDTAGNTYWARTLYTGSVSTSDYFNTKNAITTFNTWNDYTDINNILYQLKNPLLSYAGSTSSNDSEPPINTGIGYSPTDTNDATDLNCYSSWSDNLMVNYVDINITGPDLNIQTSQSVRSSSGTVSYVVPSFSLHAGTVTCSFTAYDIAKYSDSNSISFTVQNALAPSIYLVTNYPDTNALLDPNTDVNINAGIVDYNGISSVLLYKRLYDANSSSWSDWNSFEMTNDSNYSDYNFDYSYSFTTGPSNEYWQYFVQATGTNGADSNSSIHNIFSYTDYTWEQSTTNLELVSGALGTQVTVGDFNITNTGDVNLSFKLTSNWDDKSNISYNLYPETPSGYTFSVDAKETKTSSVIVIAKTTERSDALTLTISALDSNAVPDSNTITANVVSVSNGAFMFIEWKNVTYAVTQGDANIIFTARVTNAGIADANEITLDWNYPSDWTITSGSADENVSNPLSVRDYLNRTLVFSVSSSAALGNASVSFTAGCCSNLNKTHSVTNITTVQKKAEAIVTPTEEQGGAAGAGPGGGAGTGGGGGSIFSTAQEADFFTTSERFELIRGKDDEFIVKVKNPFSDRNLLGLTASVSGLLSKYLEIVNPSIGDLGPGEEKSFTVKVAAPKYFDIGKHDLVFTINGILASGKGKKETKFTYENKVVLAVHDLNVNEAISIVNSGSSRIRELEKLGINVGPLKKLLLDANLRVSAEDYEGAKTNIESILTLAGTAIQVLNDLNTISESMNKSTANGIDTPKTMRLFTIAKLAFERGEYDKANLVLKDASLTFSLETKGAFNAGYFIVQNSAQIGIGIIVALFFLGSLFLYIRRALLKRRVGKLDYEENLLLSLMKELQKACFVDNKIGMEEYQTALKHYENRLGTAVDKIINTQNELSNLISLKSKTTKLNEERQRLIDEMRNTQTQYFKEGLIESRVYNSKQTNLGKHLGEIEKDITYSSAMRTIRINSSKIKTLWKIYYAIFK